MKYSLLLTLVSIVPLFLVGCGGDFGSPVSAPVPVSSAMMPATWETAAGSELLLGKSVTSLFVDAQGSVWCGTSRGGVLRDAGQGWQVIRSESNSAPAGSEIFSIKMDRSGALWAATRGTGLLRFDGARWMNVQVDDGFGNVMDVASIDVDSEGTLWAASSKALMRRDGNRWVTYPSVAPITAIACRESGFVWLESDKGIYSFDGTDWKQRAGDNNEASGLGLLAIDRNEHLWSARAGGRTMRCQKGDDSKRRYDICGSARMKQLVVDNSGGIWAATESSVSRFAGDRWTTLGSSGLGSNVRAIASDGRGSLWAVTDAGLQHCAVPV